MRADPPHAGWPRPPHPPILPHTGGINTNVCVDTTAREAAVREFRVLFLSDGTANFDLPDGGLGAASAAELQRTACAVMAFGFAEVVTVDQVLGRIPVTASA